MMSRLHLHDNFRFQYQRLQNNGTAQEHHCQETYDFPKNLTNSGTQVCFCVSRRSLSLDTATILIQQPKPPNILTASRFWCSLVSSVTFPAHLPNVRFARNLEVFEFMIPSWVELRIVTHRHSPYPFSTPCSQRPYRLHCVPYHEF